MLAISGITYATHPSFSSPRLCLSVLPSLSTNTDTHTYLHTCPLPNQTIIDRSMQSVPSTQTGNSLSQPSIVVGFLAPVEHKLESAPHVRLSIYALPMETGDQGRKYRPPLKHAQVCPFWKLSQILYKVLCMHSSLPLGVLLYLCPSLPLTDLHVCIDKSCQ